MECKNSSESHLKSKSVVLLILIQNIKFRKKNLNTVKGKEKVK